MFVIKNAVVLNEAFEFVHADIAVEGQHIAQIAPHISGETEIDVGGAYVLPGLVNVHTHGAVGYDSGSCDYTGLNAMSKYWARTGTTSFLPTTTTAPFDDMHRAMQTIAAAAQDGVDGAAIAGIHMEGPYLSAQYKGAHRADWLKTVYEFDFDALQRAACGIIRRITIAPETDGALAFIAQHRDGLSISLGHTGASYETCMEAFRAGAAHVTHLFNAMPPLHHRDMHLICAAFESGAAVELIGDGLHVSPVAAKMAYQLFGADRIVLINDSMQAAGLGEGVYEFCGLRVTVKDGVARQDNGTICGGIASLFDCMKNMVAWGVPLAQAVKMAAYNPAKAVGLADKIGSIAVGKDADLLLVSNTLELQKVYIKGKAFTE